jgi:hypothetical protein
MIDPPWKRIVDFLSWRNIGNDPIRALIGYIDFLMVRFQVKVFIRWIGPSPLGIHRRFTVAAYTRVMRDHGITCGTTHMNGSDRLHLAVIACGLPNTNLR